MRFLKADPWAAVHHLEWADGRVRLGEHHGKPADDLRVYLAGVSEMSKGWCKGEINIPGLPGFLALTSGVEEGFPIR